MALPVFVIGLAARKAIQFASKKAAEAFIKKSGKGKVVTGLKNIGKRIKTTVKDIRAENKKLGENALTKDEAIVSGAVVAGYPVHKVHEKYNKKLKEKKKKIGIKPTVKLKRTH